MFLQFLMVLCLLSRIMVIDSDKTDADGFCTKSDNGVECVSPEEMTLTRLNGGEVGNVGSVVAEDGRQLYIKTVNTKPLVFEVEEFLTDEECDHFISVAKETGLKSSHTEKHGQSKGFVLMDLDSDQKLSLKEMRITIENGYDTYLEDEDLLEMYNALKIDTNNDQFISREELRPVNPSTLAVYLKQFLERHPEKHSRYSKQVWLFPDSSSDAVFSRVQERVSKVVQLPMSLISLSDFQVVNYGVKGHYNAHFDSSAVDPQVPCCDRGKITKCRICRYMTVLFYLNHVTGGGETAFPVANNDTLDEALIHQGGIANLYKKCADANLRVSAQKRKAIMWYNHLVDQESGWMGEMDKYTLHGGCPVTEGEKWIANFWIKASNNKTVDIAKMKKTNL